MSNNHDAKAEVILERHVEALKAERVSDGPSEQTMAATLATLRAATAQDEVKNASASGHRLFIERLVGMTMTQRIAAAVMITIGLIILYAMFGVLRTPTVAFADVVQKLKSVKTFSYSSTVTLPGRPPVTMRTLYAEGRTRTESQGAVSITDGKSLLTLEPRTKTATRVDLTGGSLPQADLGEGFRRIGSAGGEPLGEKKIDGVATRGFRTAIGNLPMTIWVDPKTALPVRIESTRATDVGETTTVMDHFEFDASTDHTAFSMEVPEGYKLTTHQVDLPRKLTPDCIVADFLREYASYSGGEFPAKLNDPEALRPVMAKIADAQKATSFIMHSSMMRGAVLALGDNCGYAGDGVKLGEKDKIVFWYRLGKSKGWTAVYGDLHAGQVNEEQLPSTRPAKG